MGSIDLVVQPKVEVELRQTLASVQPLERVTVGLIKLLESVWSGRRRAVLEEGSHWTVLEWKEIRRWARLRWIRTRHWTVGGRRWEEILLRELLCVAVQRVWSRSRRWE